MTRVLLCFAHSIQEYDELKIIHELGYEVASIGAYIEPEVHQWRSHRRDGSW